MKVEKLKKYETPEEFLKAIGCITVCDSIARFECRVDSDYSHTYTLESEHGELIATIVSSASCALSKIDYCNIGYRFNRNVNFECEIM